MTEHTHEWRWFDVGAHNKPEYSWSWIGGIRACTCGEIEMVDAGHGHTPTVICARAERAADNRAKADKARATRLARKATE